MFDRVRKLISRHGILPNQGVSEPEIATAEGFLGRFPEDYRYFLKEYGWLSVGHVEVYGLGSRIPDYLEVVRMTLLERSGSGSPIPETYVCIMNDGAGNLLCFDTAGPNCIKASPVVFWDHEKGSSQDVEVVAPSFQDWLNHLLESEL